MTCAEAADALEAQAKRIAELEGHGNTLMSEAWKTLTDRAEKAEAALAEIRANFDELNNAYQGAKEKSLHRKSRIRELETALADACAALRAVGSWCGRDIWEKEWRKTIAAARGEKESQEKSCETCVHTEHALDAPCFACAGPGNSKWQPKSDVCPTCEGSGYSENHNKGWCPACGGTGRKEKK